MPDAIQQLICFFCVGTCLVLTGGANAVCRSAAPHFRHIVTLAISSITLLGCWSLSSSINIVVQAGVILAIVLVPPMLLGSVRFLDWGCRLMQALRRPAVRAGMVSLMGLTLVIASLVAYDRYDQQKIDEDSRLLSDIGTPPPLMVATQGHARTDRGSRVVLQEPSSYDSDVDVLEREQRLLTSSLAKSRVIRHESASEHTNCHGWVFTGGQYWISGTEVESILGENDYKPVETPKPGDLVVYRDHKGVSHTGIVRYVTEGLPVMVEGKWGTSGVYLHAVDQSCYGSNFTYYRSPRNGHLLAGLNDTTPRAASPTE